MSHLQLEKRSIMNLDGEIFYYRNFSFPGRPTVIFLHGLSSNHTTWVNAMEELEKNRYNSIALDLRGHGDSDKTRTMSHYKLPVFSDDLNRIMLQENLSRPTVVGYSFGASIAMDYAIRYPDQVHSLILISPNYVSPFKYRGLGLLRLPSILVLHLLAILLLWQKRKKYYYYQHGISRGYWHSVSDGLTTMPISINLWMLSITMSIDFKETISRITAPTLLIWSSHDFFVTEKEIHDMAAALPRARISISKNSSHFIASDSQKEITESILDFLLTNNL